MEIKQNEDLKCVVRDYKQQQKEVFKIPLKYEHPLFQEILNKSLLNLGSTVCKNKIDDIKQKIEKKTYLHFTAGQRGEYLSFILNSDKYKQYGDSIETLIKRKHQLIEQDIIKQNLSISVEQKKNKKNKEHRSNHIHNQVKQKLINLSESFEGLYQTTPLSKLPHSPSTTRSRRQRYSLSQQEINQFLHKKHKQKQQRLKKLQQQFKRQEQLYQQKQIQQKKRAQFEIEIRKKKILEQKQEERRRRQLQKSNREKYHSQFINLKNHLKEEPPVFEKIQKNFENEISKIQSERNRILRERKEKLFVLNSVDSSKIIEHEQKYQQFLKKSEDNRKEKQKKRKEAELASVKYYSNYHQQKIEVEDDSKQKEKQKLQRIKNYQSKVKEKHKPKIDEQKRKQLLNMIEEFTLGPKVKKVTLEDGSVILQEIQKSDHKILGMEYLDYARKLANQYREKSMKKSKEKERQKQTEETKSKQSKLNSSNERKLRQIHEINSNSKINPLKTADKIRKIQYEDKILNEQIQNKLKRRGKKLTTDDLVKQQKFNKRLLHSIQKKVQLLSQGKGIGA